MTLNKDEISIIIKLRGLGFHHEEIADYLDISRKTVQNHLIKIKKEVLTKDIKNDLTEIFNDMTSNNINLIFAVKI